MERIQYSIIFSPTGQREGANTPEEYFKWMDIFGHSDGLSAIHSIR